MSDEDEAEATDLWDMEDNPTFEGPCTCDHTAGEHGWQGCNQPGCVCDAHWED